MISFAHGTISCNGSMLTVDIEPPKEKEEGAFIFVISGQSKIAEYFPDGTRSSSQFNGEEAFINLNVKQATHLLFVLEGKVGSINSGKGIFENGDIYTSIIHCDRIKESPFGYAIHIITKFKSGKTQNGRIILNPTEAATLAKSINSSIGMVAFGK